MKLTQDQLKFWKTNRYLLLDDYLAESQIQDLICWTEELYRWPETAGKWMKYFETSSLDDQRMLCRVENFLPFHDGFRNFLTNADLMEVLSVLMGETAVLFKEKINFKLPGGAGFKAHQDAPAFVTFKQHYHITMMVSIDATTVENGCLELVDGFCDEKLLDQDSDGTLSEKVISVLDWKPLTTKPGDILFFDSYLPHRSSPNRSRYPRRALYITYNRLSEGSRRDDYFSDKRKYFPPEVERGADFKMSEKSAQYNLGNPIR